MKPLLRARLRGSAYLALWRLSEALHSAADALAWWVLLRTDESEEQPEYRINT